MTAESSKLPVLHADIFCPAAVTNDSMIGYVKAAHCCAAQAVLTSQGICMHFFCLKSFTSETRIDQCLWTSHLMAFDRAYGAILGAFVGDAAGAVLEFRPKPTRERVSHLVAQLAKRRLSSACHA